MSVHDYNGTGKWAVESVRARYAAYCLCLNVVAPMAIEPRIYVQGADAWVYPVMEVVIEGIKRGDAACAIIGVEFIEEDSKFPFGRTLKSKTARALRQTHLPQNLANRIKKRIASMLVTGNTPREYAEYARLLRKLGLDDIWPSMAANPPTGNRVAMRYYHYFKAVYERSPAVISARTP